jgi:hypothetical protein
VEIRVFSPSSARRSLASIRASVERMAHLFTAMSRLHPRAAVRDQPVDRHYFDMLLHLTRSMERVARSGAQIKDPRLGVIDFPARREGRVVLLCWKLGEPDVGFWHEIEDGYAGRRPLDEDGLWEEPEVG